MPRPLIRCTAVALLLVTASCGTIIRSIDGGPARIPVTSVPNGATVYHRGTPVGKTPCTVTVTGVSAEITVDAPGHVPRTLQLNWSVNWLGALGNGLLLIGMPVGLAVDFATGAWRLVGDRPLHVELRRRAG